MRWTPGGSSEDVEDRRDEGGGSSGMGFGGGTSIGIGGTIVLFILSFIFKQDFFSLLGVSPGGGGTAVQRPVQSPGDPSRNAGEGREVEFVKFVLNDVQATWTRILPEQGLPYRHAKLVLFRNRVESGCGVADAATGPFYCPPDEKVYIDLGFYDELRTRFGAPGEFAQAYVLAHELGHHVQKVLGIEAKVRRAQSQNPGAANRLSVMTELQADCFAGIWGHSTSERKLLEEGEAKQALTAAAAVGDDRLQRAARGTVRPETFTHGTSAQRMAWFKRGFNTGQVSQCNTFAGTNSSD
jgi:predicted metalloprotease